MRKQIFTNVLNLGNFHIKDPDVRGLTETLASNFPLASLNLQKNQIGDTGTAALAKALRKARVKRRRPHC